MSKALDNLILERLYAAENTLVNHANAIDQKASYLLVAITFLSVQISSLLGKAWHLRWRWDLLASAMALIVATGYVWIGTRFAIIEDESAQNLEAWRDEGLEQQEDEETMLYALRYGARERILKTKELLDARANALERAFYFITVALALNLAFTCRALFL